MSHIFFNCPECRNPLKLPVGLARPSEFIICPCCSKCVMVPESTRQNLQEMPTIIRSPSKTRGHGKSLDKNIFFDCIECKEALKLSPGIVKPGDMVICPRCRKEIQVPEDDSKPLPPPTVVRRKPKGKSESAKQPGAKWQSWLILRRRKAQLIAAGCLLVVLIAALIMAGILLERKCAAKVARLVSFFDSYGEITHADIDISPCGRNVTIRDIVIRPDQAPRPIFISSLVLQRFGPWKGVPPRLDIEAHGVHVPLYPETLGKAGSAMRDLDYDSITSRITCSYNYDRSEDELAITDLLIKTPGLGDILLSLIVSRIDLTADDLTLNSLFSGYDEWEVSKGRFEYRDDSFISRFLAYQADYIGETVDELNAGMLTDLHEVISRETDPFTKKSLSDFGKFLRNTQRIIIISNPDAPVAIHQIQNTYDQKGIIGVIPELKLRFSIENQ